MYHTTPDLDSKLEHHLETGKRQRQPPGWLEQDKGPQENTKAGSLVRTSGIYKNRNILD